MPTHLGANPRNHVKHYPCSSLENFLLLLIKLMAHISYFLFYFFGTGGGDLAEGVAEEPRRGCSINKP
jgi:hypothetical protein